MTTITPELLSQFLKTSYLPCQVIHDNPCLLSAFKRFMLNIRTSTKLFLPLYLIPTILMKRKQLKSSAGPILKETMKNCLRTIGFVSTWFALWKYCLCKTKDIRMTVDGWNAIIAGFLSGLSIVFETEGKISMITLLMIPRVLETCWNLMKKRGYVPKNDMILGQIVLYGVVMGIINLFYQNKQEAINPSYLKAFKALWGVN